VVAWKWCGELCGECGNYGFQEVSKYVRNGME
jgi:hypothetical protein